MKKKEDKIVNKDDNNKNQDCNNTLRQNSTNFSSYNEIKNKNSYLFGKEIINKKIYLKKIHLFLLIMNQIHQKIIQKTLTFFYLQKVIA